MMENPPINIASLRTNLESQLLELEMLESMFPDPGDIKIEDPAALKEIQSYAQNPDTKLSPDLPYLDLTVNLTIDQTKFELCVNLSHDYPSAELPDFYIRNHLLNKTQHSKINTDCNDFIKTEIPVGEPCIYTVISWIMDNAQNYLITEATVTVTPTTTVAIINDKLVRYWIYSHHIYSKTKRREILSLAQHKQITGFCMPGKPGVICIEGTLTDCDEWWSTIRAMTWKRIVCKVTEECKKRKFTGFEEIAFQPNGLRSNHCDLGELNRYLERHGLGYVFKELFGVDGKNSV